MTRAARAAGMPVVISFTVETDGRLPTGETLRDAIQRVDRATDGGPAYYMINCAHPTHFEQRAATTAAWMARLRGIRANASRQQPRRAGRGDGAGRRRSRPSWAGSTADLRGRLPHLNVLGGCCGTDHRHIEQICRNCGQTA